MNRTRPRVDVSIDQDASWRQAKYCVIDVETTGLDLRRDEIVSVGSVHIRDGRIICAESYYSLVRPAREISVPSMRVHGLRRVDLENAPNSADVGQEIADQLAERIVVAHAAWIERAFLGRLLGQVGLKLAHPMVDTAGLARALGLAETKVQRTEPSLEALARQLYLPVYSPHHALGDALTTAAVFLAMATRAELQASPGGNQPMAVKSLLQMAAQFAN